MRMRSLALTASLLGLLALTIAPVRAQIPVTLHTGPLNGLGTYFLDFQLLDGSGIGDGNSTVTISGLTLSGGALGALQPLHRNGDRYAADDPDPCR